MVKIHPIPALTVNPSRAAEITCVPYDIVSRAESRALAQNHPDTLLRVDRADLEFPDSVKFNAPEVYQKAAQNFSHLIENGSLLKETKPSIYLVRMVEGKHRQRGFAALADFGDYASGQLRKHEFTRPDKEDDRVTLIRHLGALTGPVLAAYPDLPELTAQMDKIESTEKPLAEVTDERGVQHTVWRCPDAAEIVKLFTQVSRSYIADGHHRAAAAARLAKEKVGPLGILTVYFPASELRVLPYHRLVLKLDLFSPATFLEEAKKVFQVTPSPSAPPDETGKIGLFLEGKWYQLSWSADPKSDPVAKLDASALQDRLLGPILQVKDPRTDARLDFVGGIHGTKSLENRVNSGQAAAAFSLPAVSLSQILAVADADQIMPPKSTWFEPKLRSGFYVHQFAPAQP
ncbi:MAG: hypothetical protein ABS32_00590 [Verrucomicrobia subdivision 6 bacterium BACL9 MAG-120820-bin42]|jgi:uncharacterized protein (DUF1015 family)|uniref:DUF1015 domain-containing protein n=3 Tax=Verrucomicrobia subdivision 6 TaxID=134627 RepID=A0A0R2XGG4_9BACT|nr:MAG: hypothetical protein ABR82_00405 [Verrucomicrobia subdivision 6 bacterium BACL9 MAG-120507-bin52]KRP33315.1 MAG: hypothetical protein ABS32_00590 [Verrucomicrobia subdivision 6 bacterium BACL9 MAG-120820-bin42]